MSLKEKLGTVLKRKKAFDDSDGDQSTGDKKDKKQQPEAATQPKPAASAPPKAPDAEVVKLEGQIATLQEGLGKIESSITKAVTASSSGFEENIKSLMQKLDDVVIAMQATQSDKNSPFNSPSLVQELPESVGLANEDQKAQPAQQQSASTGDGSVHEKSGKSSEDSHETSSLGTKNSEIAKAIQEIQEADARGQKDEADQIKEMLRATAPPRLPLVSTRLQEFVKSCALLEILESDHKRLNYLYDIGILRTEDLETASRIIDLLGRYSPNLKPVDLAVIACSIEETAASDRETRKLLAIATALNKSR